MAYVSNAVCLCHAFLNPNGGVELRRVRQ